MELLGVGVGVGVTICRAYFCDMWVRKALFGSSSLGVRPLLAEWGSSLQLQDSKEAIPSHGVPCAQHECFMRVAGLARAYH